jgi:hypothetical protein
VDDLGRRRAEGIHAGATPARVDVLAAAPELLHDAIELVLEPGDVRRVEDAADDDESIAVERVA